jgi:hypothetical protein
LARSAAGFRCRRRDLCQDGVALALERLDQATSERVALLLMPEPEVLQPSLDFRQPSAQGVEGISRRRRCRLSPPSFLLQLAIGRPLFLSDSVDYGFLYGNVHWVRAAHAFLIAQDGASSLER